MKIKSNKAKGHYPGDRSAMRSLRNWHKKGTMTIPRTRTKKS